MPMAFESVRNYHEEAVFQQVTDRASGYPAMADDPDLLEDVACVALNRIPAKYIRSKVDMIFYLDDGERIKNELVIRAAVEAAFRFVAARMAAGTRG